MDAFSSSSVEKPDKKILEERHFDGSSKCREIVTPETVKKILPILVFAYDVQSHKYETRGKSETLCKTVTRLNGNTFNIFTPNSLPKYAQAVPAGDAAPSDDATSTDDSDSNDDVDDDDFVPKDDSDDSTSTTLVPALLPQGNSGGSASKTLVPFSKN